MNAKASNVIFFIRDLYTFFVVYFLYLPTYFSIYPLNPTQTTTRLDFSTKIGKKRMKFEEGKSDKTVVRGLTVSVAAGLPKGSSQLEYFNINKITIPVLIL